MKQRQLNFRFHDPNPAGAAADLLLQVFLEAGREKVEQALRAAAATEETDIQKGARCKIT